MSERKPNGRPNKVMIDGVLYVPASEGFANARAMKCALVNVFWGSIRPDISDKELAEKAYGLSVRVMDDCEGDPLDEVLAGMAVWTDER